MIYVKINETLYPATVNGKMVDHEWDNRKSKAITLETDYETAKSLFVDGVAWSIVERTEAPYEEPVFEVNENGEYVIGEDGERVQIGVITKTEPREVEWDNSEFTIAGDIIDHRDGRITVKMGKLTDLEKAYEIMLGGVL